MATANAIRAGRAFVEIFADSRPLMRGLRAVSARLKAFGVQIAAIGRRMMMMGAMIAAPFVLAVRHFTKVGDALDKMSKRTGFSVKALSGLIFAARRSGTSIEAVEKAVKRMQRTIYDAGRGLAETTDALGELGLTFADLEGKSPEEQFRLIARRLATVADASKKAALAQILFGRAGTMILPMLKGYDALIAKAKELGLVLTAKDIASAHAFADAWGDLMDVLKINVFMVGSALAPALVDWSKAIVDSLKNLKEWGKANRGLSVLLAKLTAGYIALGAAIWLLGTAFKALAIAIAIATFALKAFGIMLAIVTSPITLIIALAVGLTYAILKLSGVWDRAFEGMGKIFSETWGAITNALAAGDLEAAFKALTTAISYAWYKMTWDFRAGWIEAVAIIKRVWEKLTFAIKDAIALIVWSMRAMWANVKRDAIGAWTDIQELLGIISAREAAKRQAAAAREAGRARKPGADNRRAHEERLRQIAKEKHESLRGMYRELAERKRAWDEALAAARAAKAEGLGIPGAGGGPDLDAGKAAVQRVRQQVTYNPFQVGGYDPAGKRLDAIKALLQKQLEKQDEALRRQKRAGFFPLEVL